MSRTIEIRPDQWFDYLEGLGRRAKDYPVRIEMQDPDYGEKVLARTAPLFGISLEKKGSESNNIGIVVGVKDGDFEHQINSPTRIYVLQNDDGNLECIQFEDRSGGKTLVFFERLPGLPSDIYAEHEAQAGAP